MTTTTEPAFGLKPTTPGEVAKAIVYIALAAVTILITALADNHLSAVELIQVGIVVAGAVPVYLLAGRWPKTIATLVVAGGQAVLLLVTEAGSFGAVDLGSWLGVFVTALGAIGVHFVPNAPPLPASVSDGVYNVTNLAPTE